MTKKIPTIAIVGRTNVGKSTLFNVIVGKRRAIVEDSPGVTRDRHYALVERDGRLFTLIDTGGMFGEEEGNLQALVRKQSELAINEADLVIALFDGVDGVHPYDKQVADILRRSRKKVLWVVNKCEKPSTEILSSEFYALGIDGLIFISAAHNRGINELLELISAEAAPSDDSGLANSAEEKAMRVAIIGRPNVGKSTFFNRILGQERTVTSPEAGTTTDSIDVSIVRDGECYRLVDTAGLRKKARIEEHSTERYSNLRALKSLAQSDVAILMLDATQGLPSDQDAKLAGLIHERGKGLVLAVNKWDAIEKDHRTVKAYKDAIQSVLRFTPYAPILFISALSGRRCPNVLASVKEVYEAARIRIPTADLNKILKRAFEQKPPPVYRGEPIKLFFATQAEVSPPTLVLFVNHPARLNFSYERYLKNTIRKHYPFEGSDIKIYFRKRTEKAERNKPERQASNC